MKAAVGDEARLRVWLYRHTLLSGGIPSVAQISRGRRMPARRVHRELHALAAKRSLVLQPNGREILMLMPFSAVPTAFRVHVGSRSYWANCAWDALGIPAMVDRPARVETSCACCGEQITLHADRRVRAKPAALMHFAVPARHWWDDLVFT